MYYLKFKDITYEVDHAVKGVDYIHGYNADGVRVVAFEGITDFSVFEYDGEYMAPTECLEDPCNNLRVVGGQLLRSDGANTGNIGMNGNTFTGLPDPVGDSEPVTVNYMLPLLRSKLDKPHYVDDLNTMTAFCGAINSSTLNCPPGKRSGLVLNYSPGAAYQLQYVFELGVPGVISSRMKVNGAWSGWSSVSFTVVSTTAE